MKIKKVKKLNNFIIIALFAINYQIANEVVYIRYFEDDLNFKSNISMLSTERRGLKHMAVSYDENNQPVKIEYFTARGVLDKREMLKYDDNQILVAVTEKRTKTQIDNYVNSLVEVNDA